MKYIFKNIPVKFTTEKDVLTLIVSWETIHITMYKDFRKHFTYLSYFGQI